MNSEGGTVKSEVDKYLSEDNEPDTKDSELLQSIFFNLAKEIWIGSGFGNS